MGMIRHVARFFSRSLDRATQSLVLCEVSCYQLGTVQRVVYVKKKKKKATALLSLSLPSRLAVSCLLPKCPQAATPSLSSRNHIFGRDVKASVIVLY